MSGDSYLWIGPTSGDWQAALNWEDLTSGSDPATIAPGSLDNVTFMSGVDLVQVINGNGNAASLILDGNNLITGKIDASTLAGEGTLGIAQGATLSAASGAMEGSFDVQGIDALAKISGDFLWGFGGLDAAAGGDIRIGGTLNTNGNDTYLDVQSGGTISAAELLLTGRFNYVSVAGDGILQIGHGAAVAGELVIEAGAMLVQQERANAYLQSDVVDNGTIISDDLLECASISGTGTLVGTSGAALNLGNISGLRAIALDNCYASISNAISASHINIVQGSLEADVVNAASGGTGITLSGDSQLTVLDSVGAGVKIAMQGAENLLVLGSGGETKLSFAGTLLGFAGNDAIEIDGVPISSVKYETGKHGAAGVIDLFENGTQDGSIALTGTFKDETFHLVTIGSGEVEITLTAATPESRAHDDANRTSTLGEKIKIAGRAIEVGGNDSMAFIHLIDTAGAFSMAEKAFPNRNIGRYGTKILESFSIMSPFYRSMSLTPKPYRSGGMNWTSTTASSQLLFGNQRTEPKLGVYDASGGLLSNVGTFS